VGAVALAIGAIVATSLLYADRQHQFAIEQAEAGKRITKLATDLESERGHLALSLKESNRRLATQLLERGQVAFEKGQIGPGLLWTLEGWRSAAEAADPAWRRAARASLSAWAGEYPRLRAVFSPTRRPSSGSPSAPTARTAATASEDQTARLWDVATATPIGPPIEHAGLQLALAFSPDGKTLRDRRRGECPDSGTPPPAAPSPRCRSLKQSSRSLRSARTDRVWSPAAGTVRLGFWEIADTRSCDLARRESGPHSSPQPSALTARSS